ELVAPALRAVARQAGAAVAKEVAEPVTEQARAAVAKQSAAQRFELCIDRVRIVENAGHVRINARFAPVALDHDRPPKSGAVRRTACVLSSREQTRIDLELHAFRGKVDRSCAGYAYDRTGQLEIVHARIAIADAKLGAQPGKLGLVRRALLPTIEDM